MGWPEPGEGTSSRDSEPRVWAVLTAAGSGSRLGADVPKALVRVQDRSLLSLALDRLLQCDRLAGVVVTCPPGLESEFASSAQLPPGSAWVRFVAGGQSRQSSVKCGLDVLSQVAQSDDVVLVHDAARCLAPPALMDRLTRTVKEGHDAAIPGIPVTDTIKQVTTDTSGMELVVATPVRSQLRAVQTPQAFRWQTLWDAHVGAVARGQNEAMSATDDAELVEGEGKPVVMIPGSELAFKVTTAADLDRLSDALSTEVQAVS